MANVSFKRGLSTALSNVAVEDGVFYLTTDTNRLYVGQGSKLAELNQSVTTYATWADMEASAPKQEGQFYYAIQENVLACYLPELNKWQQINPDHNDNDDTYVSSLSVGSADKSETGKLKYTITVGQKTKHQGKAETTVTPNITGQLEISSEDLNAIASNVAVGVKTDAITGNENGLVLKTTGGGADADTNIAIVGGDNVNISRSGNGKTITIKSTDTNTTYDLLSNAGDANITLHGSDNADRTVSFVGAQQIEVSGANEREIAIKHKDSPVTDGSYNSSIDGNKITVPSFTVDQQGHITSASTNELTIPTPHDTKTSIKSVSAGNDGRIGIIYAQDNEEHTVYSNADLYYKITVDGTTETTIKNQGSLGKFYSSSKVDELIRQAAANMNAMTYKGVVASDTFATTVAGAQKGDTYKANGEIVIGSQTAKTGDLIIYKGEDLADGSAPENTDFDVIPSGDEIDSQFALSGTGNAIVLTNTTKDNTPAGSVSVSGTDGILAEVTNNTLSIKHTNTIATGASSVGEDNNVTPAAGNSFKVPSISYDAQGHITSANNITVTLPDDTTYSLGTAAGDTQYDAYINLTPVTGSGAGTTSAKFKAGANIEITGSGDKITVAHSDPGDAVGNVIGNNTKTALGYSDTFIVPKITKDANGHIVNTEDVVLTLPKEVAIPTIGYAGETTLNENTNRVTMSSSLTVGSAVKTYSPSIGSSTLKLSTSSTNSNDITIDLEWGSF